MANHDGPPLRPAPCRFGKGCFRGPALAGPTRETHGSPSLNRPHDRQSQDRGHPLWRGRQVPPAGWTGCCYERWSGWTWLRARKRCATPRLSEKSVTATASWQQVGSQTTLTVRSRPGPHLNREHSMPVRDTNAGNSLTGRVAAIPDPSRNPADLKSGVGERSGSGEGNVTPDNFASSAIRNLANPLLPPYCAST